MQITREAAAEISRIAKSKSIGAICMPLRSPLESDQLALSVVLDIKAN